MEFIKDMVTQLAKHFLTHEQFQSLLYYISQEGKSKNFEQFYVSLAEALPNYTEDIMTLAQQLEQKGLQRGLQEGLQQGRHEGLQQGEYLKAMTIARNMLAEGLPLELVKKITKLPDLELAELD